jgi:hypothetical protein
MEIAEIPLKMVFNCDKEGGQRAEKFLVQSARHFNDVENNFEPGANFSRFSKKINRSDS